MNRNFLAVLVAGLLAVGLLSGCGATTEDSWTNEGSMGSPVTLSIGVAHNAVVGGLPPYDSSWYRFTATGTSHAITLSSVPDDLEWWLYDGFFSGLIGNCDNNFGSAPESCDTGTTMFPTTTLSISSQYGIEVYNQDISQVSFTITVN